MYCRYTLFVLLYPLGVVSELVLIVKAMPYLEQRDMYNIHLPNAWNFSFDYAIFMKVRSRSAFDTHNQFFVSVY